MIVNCRSDSQDKIWREIMGEPYVRIMDKGEWGRWLVLSEEDRQGMTCKRYVYKPLNDITAYELALIVPVLHTKINIERMIELLPPEAKRHFEEV